MNNFIGDNVNAIRVHYGLNQEKLAEMMGVSQTTVSAWECGESTPRRNNINKLIEALPDLKFDDVMSEENGFAKRVNKTITGYTDTPLFGSIAAGKPIDMDEADGTYPVPTPICERYNDVFLLKVEGESMNKVLPNGSYALIERCVEVERDNQPYAICINGYAATIKRVRRLNNGFELVPDSTDPTYLPQVFNYNEPGTDVITVLGRVVYHVLPFDWEY